MDKKDLTLSDRQDVADFIEKVRSLPQAHAGALRGRLIFALDATASREPTWDMAAHLQAQMFEEAARIGGLDVQLVFYRGFGECRSSAWVSSAAELVRLMGKVRCAAGRTQVERVLRHALSETERRRVHALVFVGDAMEEDLDALGHAAGQLGLAGVRAFLFHEGINVPARKAFEEVARLTGGACCRFDAGAARELGELLRAVAAYAAGGLAAVRALSDRSPGAVRLLEQLR